MDHGSYLFFFLSISSAAAHLEAYPTLFLNAPSMEVLQERVIFYMSCHEIPPVIAELIAEDVCNYLLDPRNNVPAEVLNQSSTTSSEGAAHLAAIVMGYLAASLVGLLMGASQAHMEMNC